MLYDNEKSMLFIDNYQDKVFKMDLNRGTIVDEYSTDGITKVQNICSEFKNSQKTIQNEFIGINSKGMFQFDPRLNTSNKIVKQ